VATPLGFDRMGDVELTIGEDNHVAGACRADCPEQVPAGSCDRRGAARTRSWQVSDEDLPSRDHDRRTVIGGLRLGHTRQEPAAVPQRGRGGRRRLLRFTICQVRSSPV
jgi:hypothetical protein